MKCGVSWFAGVAGSIGVKLSASFSIAVHDWIETRGKSLMDEIKTVTKCDVSSGDETSTSAWCSQI